MWSSSHSASQSPLQSLETTAKSQDLAEASRSELNQLFVLTNEYQPEQTLKRLARRQLAGNTIIGVSGLFVLDILVARLAAASSTASSSSSSSKSSSTSKLDAHIEYVVVLDRAESVVRFWSDFRDLILSDAGLDRLVFVKKLCAMLSDGNHAHTYFGDSEPSLRQCIRVGQSYCRELRQRAADTKCPSWLSLDATFESIRAFFKRNRILVHRFDFGNKACLKTLTRGMLKHKMQLDTLYISNVPEYLYFGNTLNDFIKAFQPLVSTHTTIIDSITYKTPDCERFHPQRMYTGKWFSHEYVHVPPEANPCKKRARQCQAEEGGLWRAAKKQRITD